MVRSKKPMGILRTRDQLPVSLIRATNLIKIIVTMFFQDLYSVTQCLVWIHFYLSICQYWNMFVQVSVRRRGEMNAYFLSFSSSGDGTEDSIISPAFWSLRNISGKKRTLMWASSQVVNSLSDGIVWFLFVAWSDWSVFVAIWLVREATRDFLDVITLAVTCLSSFSPGWLILCNAKLNKNWPGMLISKTKIRLKYLIHETPSIKGDEKQAKKPWKTNEDDTKAELEDLWVKQSREQAPFFVNPPENTLRVAESCKPIRKLHVYHKLLRQLIVVRTSHVAKQQDCNQMALVPLSDSEVTEIVCQQWYSTLHGFARFKFSNCFLEELAWN